MVRQAEIGVDGSRRHTPVHRQGPLPPSVTLLYLHVDSIKDTQKGGPGSNSSVHSPKVIYTLTQCPLENTYPENEFIYLFIY